MSSPDFQLIFKSLVTNSEGNIVENEKNEILCIVEDSLGNHRKIFLERTNLEGACLIPVSDFDTSINHINQNHPTNPTNLSNINECSIWKTSKSQTEKDHNATLLLLKLRLEYDKEFSDKKTVKNTIWSKISTQLNNSGYFVSEGTVGREKVRQKLSNLQTSFQKYLQKRNQTGEGFVENPQYFEELDKILGSKHKVSPPFVIDSEIYDKIEESKIESTPKPGTSKQSSDDAGSQAGSSSCSDITNNRPNKFTSTKKTVRPQKEKERIISVMKTMHAETIEERRREFNAVIDLMNKENNQRHEEIMAILRTLGSEQKHSTPTESSRRDGIVKVAEAPTGILAKSENRRTRNILSRVSYLPKDSTVLAKRTPGPSLAYTLGVARRHKHCYPVTTRSRRAVHEFQTSSQEENSPKSESPNTIGTNHPQVAHSAEEDSPPIQLQTQAKARVLRTSSELTSKEGDEQVRVAGNCCSSRPGFTVTVRRSYVSWGTAVVPGQSSPRPYAALLRYLLLLPRTRHGELL
ncbi:hypothetical protein NQ315_012475 [Exocentrus adspersus]|uniref:Myb/SANT-like DNA-binding domain-containing protein n=1 Tax=Exocentrus adspersus TaxID=1586481 RepID=A0AAV8VP59_9CUCU|nr:hypothetical protein NQ315_012475 [Exocentrus adspersus]